MKYIFFGYQIIGNCISQIIYIFFNSNFDRSPHPTEYNVLQPSPLNEKVLREKRKKLKETFDRVMRLYVC